MRDPEQRDPPGALRRGTTGAEQRLWYHLRRRHLAGHRFRRHCPVGPYIADFACLERRLIVELERGQQAGPAHDRCRDAYLHRRGFRVLRFWHHRVSEDLEALLAEVDRALR